MITYACVRPRLFMAAFFVLLAGGLLRPSLGQQEPEPIKSVVLQQRMFVQSLDGAAPLKERLNLQSLDGAQVAFDQLPVKVKEGIVNLATRVFSLLEMNKADPRDTIRMIVRKPMPKHMIRLGLVADPKEQEADPPWLADLSFGEKRLSCVVTNVSFLDISIVLADAFGWEFGVTTDGQAAFRNKEPAVEHIRQPLYLVKPKSPKSQ